MAITTQQLVDEIRLYSNLKNNQYFSDLDIIRFANDARAELYDIVVDAGQHYRIKTFDFTLSGGTQTVTVPADFYKDNLLELNPGTPQVQTVDMLENYLERNKLGGLDVYAGPGCDRRYLIEDLTLRVLPVANSNASAGNYRLYYTPFLSDLALPINVDLAITPDTTVAAMTSSPVLGTWTAITPGSIQYHALGSDPPFTVDGHIVMLGERVFFQKDDAPISEETMGAWEFAGVSESGGDLFYNLVRPNGYQFTDQIQIGHKIFMTFGDFFANVTKQTDSTWEVGVDTTTVSGTNYAATSGSDPRFHFANPTFTFAALQSVGRIGWFPDAVITLENTPSDGGVAWPITAIASEFQASVGQPDFNLLTPFDIPSTAVVQITFTSLAYVLEQILLPWHIYIVVHASRTIRQARQQGVTELETQLLQLKQRIVKMSANRNENVTQAPYLRRRRRGPWGISGL